MGWRLLRPKVWYFARTKQRSSIRLPPRNNADTTAVYRLLEICSSVFIQIWCGLLRWCGTWNGTHLFGGRNNQFSSNVFVLSPGNCMRIMIRPTGRCPLACCAFGNCAPPDLQAANLQHEMRPENYLHELAFRAFWNEQKLGGKKTRRYGKKRFQKIQNTDFLENACQDIWYLRTLAHIYIQTQKHWKYFFKQTIMGLSYAERMLYLLAKHRHKVRWIILQTVNACVVVKGSLWINNYRPLIVMLWGKEEAALILPFPSSDVYSKQKLFSELISRTCTCTV